MPAEGTATLAYAVRPRVVLWLLGQLLLPLTVLAAVPMAFALASGQIGFATRCAIVSAVFLAAGWRMARIRPVADIRTNETMSATALVFLIAAATMTWPFTAEGLEPLDAWLESVSAITTTGLTTLPVLEGKSPAFLFTRAWMQWYGGLAIVVLAVALLLEPGVAARRLAGGEAESADVVGTTRRRARFALSVYIALTLLAFVLLAAAGATPFDALVHAFAAVSTGGFSSHTASLGAAGGLGVAIAATAISFCGAVSLTLYVRGWQGNWRAVGRDPDLRGLVLATLACTILVGVFMVLVDGRPLAEAIRNAPLIAISAQTTTGFSTLDVGALDPASKLTLIGSMIVGGDIGSTAGGIKITRVLVVLALIRLVFMRTRLPPHAVAEPAVAGRRLNAPDVQFAVAVIVLHLSAVALSWLAFVAAGHAPLDSLFEVASATGTVGLSTGLTATSLAPGLKLLLTADMMLGRLEVVAFMVLLYPGTWFGRRAGP